MPPFEKHLLEETARMTEENNKILRSMQRAAWWSRSLSLLKWIIVIIVTFGTYYYFQPYLEALLKLYSNLGTIPGFEAFQEVFKK